jgi:hypothetical protein
MLVVPVFLGHSFDPKYGKISEIFGLHSSVKTFICADFSGKQNSSISQYHKIGGENKNKNKNTHFPL